MATPTSALPTGLRNPRPEGAVAFRFLVRWTAAIVVSVLIASIVQYALAVRQYEQRTLEQSAAFFQRDVDALEAILVVDRPAAETQVLLVKELHAMTAHDSARFAALFDGRGAAVAGTGGEKSTLALRDVERVVTSWRPAVAAEDDADERGQEARFEFLLPVRAPGGAMVLELDVHAPVMQNLLSDLRRLQALGAVLVVVLVVPLSYLLGGRTLQKQAQKLQENAGVLAEQGEQLSELAFRDPLTGLANRALFKDRLGQALAAGRSSVSVLLVDLDDFKTVNDVLGHHVGDALLTEVARRLLTCAGPGDTVARLGGDEFVLVLEGHADPQAVALDVVRAIRRPAELDGRSVQPSGSVGIAVADLTGTEASELLRRADIAMYEAKAAGKNQCALFRPDMTVAVVALANLEQALRTAVELREIVTHYQPVVESSTGQATRVEVLVRWQRSTGLVSPAEFLPVAEASGAIVGIGREVLRQACEDLRAWLAADEERAFAVNASAVELRDAGFASAVLATLSAAQVAPAQLILELTESLFLDPGESVLDQLAQLRAAGCRIAIDDFGTGYSSLSRLQTLPVDELKIDKSFIDPLQSGHDEVPILTSMIAMAHNLGLQVTAEGVETVEQAIRLTGLGCEHLQGYYFARPERASAFGDACCAAERAACGTLGTLQPVEPRRVVVVDDDGVTRLLARMALTQAGLDVSEASTGTRGLDLVKALLPDCVVVDLGLPDMHGTELIQALRADPVFQGTAIVALTGAADRDTKARTFASGADDYVVKPFVGRDLAARVRTAVASAQLTSGQLLAHPAASGNVAGDAGSS